MRSGTVASLATQAQGVPQAASRGRRLRFQRLVRLGLQASDLLLINLAFVAAYYSRYLLGLGGDVPDENFVELPAYLPVEAGLTLTLYAIYHVAGLYRRPTRRPLLEETWALLQATSFGMMLIFAAVFLFRGFAYSRGLFLIAWGLVLAFLVASRLLARAVQAVLRRRGIGERRVLVVGGEPLGMTVMHILATEPGLGYRLMGFVQNGDAGDLGRFKRLGALQDMPQVLQGQQVDEVIVALPSSQHHLISDITEQCQREGVVFRIVPDLFEMSLSQVDVEDLRGIPVIGVKDVSISSSNLLLKRALDVALAGLLSLALAPLWLLIALAIKLDSPGPVFFVQTRLGKNGRPFPALKFRSMRVDSEALLPRLQSHNEATGPLFKMRNDPRVTRVGHWLRRSSLDELPQLWNVLRGEMSLVGPRPPLPSEVEQYQEWHRKRLTVAPGLTGLWQVSGRSELPFDEMVLLDIYYIENWSLGLDFQILLRTIPAVLLGSGAY
ncbi:MAG: sugar transferase [Chloroflexi bacterium]|nr:sugar transferase [Chloroflexota bacterium]